MVVDIVLIIVVVFLGGLLGLCVELLKYFYPIYLALLLFFTAELLTLLGRIMKLTTRQEL